MELLQYIEVGFIGLASGIVVSSAIFSVLVALGAINKTACVLGRADKIVLLEWVLIWGAVLNNIFYLFFKSFIGGNIILIIMGGFFGVFVGIMLMALAETTRVIPILFMRIGMNRGLLAIILAITLGKVFGSIIGLLL